MKHLLFALLMLPMLGLAQEATKQSDFQGSQLSDCLKYAIKELGKGEKGVLQAAVAGRVTPQTKTIYISRQQWIKDMPAEWMGINYKYVDIDSNIKEIAEDVATNHAAVFYFSPIEVKSNYCEMWLMPIDVKKVSKKKYTQEYKSTGYKMNFFFNYDPPTYEYRGTDAVQL